MDFNTFCAEQDRIYGILRGLEQVVMSEGIRPDPGLVRQQGGFYLSFIHPVNINRQAAALSERVAGIVPAKIHRIEELHTTAGSLEGTVEPNFYFDENLPKHAELLQTAVAVAGEAARNIPAGSCKIRFEELPVITRENIVAPGQPNQAFVDAVGVVLEAGKKLRVPIAPPWGAHITLSRFAAVVEPEKLAALFRLRDAEPLLGQSTLIGIAAGYVRRHPSERNVTDLRATPGPFVSVQFFPFV